MNKSPVVPPKPSAQLLTAKNRLSTELPRDSLSNNSFLPSFVSLPDMHNTNDTSSEKMVSDDSLDMNHATVEQLKVSFCNVFLGKIRRNKC